MYLPKSFSSDHLFALEVMRSCGMASVISWTGRQAEVSHVPVMVDSTEGKATVRFHLALRNGHCAYLKEGAACLLTFLGPNCYVSPSWYEEQPNVPTWNYVAVHARGHVSPMRQDELEQLLSDLTNHHEARAGAGFSYAALPREFQLELLAEIRGFTVRVTELEAKAKLSQNRPTVDRDRVTRELLQSADPNAAAVGRLMAAKFGT